MHRLEYHEQSALSLFEVEQRGYAGMIERCQKPCFMLEALASTGLRQPFLRHDLDRDITA